jgi:hypothetical protein
VSYRVINFDTEEIAAELGDLDLAIKMADRLAMEGEHWAVVELVTRYEAKKGETKP